MKSIIKVQQTKSNTTINIPKDIRNIFSVKKGEKLLIEAKGSDELVIKKV